MFGLAAVAEKYDDLLRRFPASAGLWLVGTVIGSIAIAGPLRWLVGGWWFRVRIRWSGAPEADREGAAAIFGFSELVHVVPLLAWTLVDAVFAPIAPRISPTLLLAAAWSQLVAYQGVRAAFPVSPWKARVWFLVLPGLFYAWAYWRS